MQVTIGQSKPGMWVAVAGSKIVAWAGSYSEVLMICRENGWTVVK